MNYRKLEVHFLPVMVADSPQGWVALMDVIETKRPEEALGKNLTTIYTQPRTMSEQHAQAAECQRKHRDADQKRRKWKYDRQFDLPICIGW